MHVGPEVSVPEGIKIVSAGVDTVGSNMGAGGMPVDLTATLDALKERARLAEEAVSSRWRFDGEAGSWSSRMAQARVARGAGWCAALTG